VSLRIRVTFDDHNIRVLANSIEAVGRTMHQTGVGYIYAGARRRMPIDRKRAPMSAFAICRWIAKTRGVNVLAPDSGQQWAIGRYVKDGVNKAVRTAIQTKREQSLAVKATLGRGHGGAAKMLHDYAYRTIASGKTGLHNTPRRAAKKAALARVKTFRMVMAPGWRSLGSRSGASEWSERVRQREEKAGGGPATTDAFGMPPPFLIDTGRLIKALAPRWRLGTRETAYVREGPT
jgi:hypothetical protein